MAERLMVSDEHMAKARAYRVEVVHSDDDECFIATSPDFVGLVGAGDTTGAAAEELTNAVATAIAHATELGRPVPAPLDAYSGQFQVRTPKSLHRALKARADAEGVSVNALVNHLLTHALALDDAIALPKPRRTKPTM